MPQCLEAVIDYSRNGKPGGCGTSRMRVDGTDGLEGRLFTSQPVLIQKSLSKRLPILIAAPVGYVLTQSSEILCVASIGESCPVNNLSEKERSAMGSWK